MEGKKKRRSAEGEAGQTAKGKIVVKGTWVSLYSLAQSGKRTGSELAVKGKGKREIAFQF